jgi:DegV family protein with EDD domain
VIFLSIKIITDNCCDLPAELLKTYNIDVVPLRVRFGDEEIPPEQFDNAAFYHRMQMSPGLPNTSQPLPVDFLAEYYKALENNQEVLSIHLSSGISGTVQAANLAAGMVENAAIHVVDTLKASVGEGLMVLEAARMAESGEDVQVILERMQEMQARLRCIFVVGNLEALVKGGRLSRVKALVAGTLDIKPVLHMDDLGQIVPMDRARGHKGSRKKLIDLMESLGSDLARQTVGICHSACPEDAQHLKQTIAERFKSPEIIIGEIGPVIGSHVGPGTFSVFFEE